ncbi:hypothetical protein [Isoptericola sp. NPDC056134]|uniref:phage upper tail fiber protein n=1 Tax=Isoptericola sp. NPDC056134 TaxID=3345723 RepID=UPI0035F0A132
MTIFTFSGLWLTNPDGSPAPFATSPIFAKSDTARATPLTALDLSGTTTLPGGVTADGNGKVPDFKVDVPDGMPWIVTHAAGLVDTTLLSIDEVMNVVQASAVSAAAAAGDAEAAKTAAEDAEAAIAAAPIALPVGGTTGQALVKASGANRDVTWATVGGGTGGGGGVSDHGLLSGLTDDDHPQYHTDTRGDQRYYRKAEVDAIATTAAGANSNADRNRANHTGTQPISSVTNLESRLAAVEAGGGGGGGPITADGISDATTVGKALMRATSAANGRTTLGAAAATDVAGKVSGPTGMVIAPPMTQAAYDALPTKAPLTLYPIIG